MGNLREELRRKGLVSSEQIKTVRNREEIDRINRAISDAKNIAKVYKFDPLDLTPDLCVKEFKFRARDILLHDPTKLLEVIKAAHKLPVNLDGRPRLVAALLELRNNTSLPFEQLVNRLLSKKTRFPKKN